MPLGQTANQAVHDFGAPGIADAVLAWRVRNHMGGKIRLRVERAPTTPDPPADDSVLTFSVQVAPMLATGLPGVFIATTAAANLEAITNETVTQQGCSRSYEILIRSGIDDFVLFKASGGCRGQVIIEGDSIFDLWNTSQGMPNVTAV